MEAGGTEKESTAVVVGQGVLRAYADSRAAVFWKTRPPEEIRVATLEVLGELGQWSALEVAARPNSHQEVRELAAVLLEELKP